jgi:hypothetical protein
MFSDWLTKLSERPGVLGHGWKLDDSLISKLGE